MSISTLQQLQAMYPDGPHISLDLARKDFFTAFRSTKTLLMAIRAGRVKLVVTKECESRKAPPVVYLTHLAQYLDSRATTQPAVDTKAA